VPIHRVEGVGGYLRAVARPICCRGCELRGGGPAGAPRAGAPGTLRTAAARPQRGAQRPGGALLISTQTNSTRSRTPVNAGVWPLSVVCVMIVPRTKAARAHQQTPPARRPSERPCAHTWERPEWELQDAPPVVTACAGAEVLVQAVATPYSTHGVRCAHLPPDSSGLRSTRGAHGARSTARTAPVPGSLG